MFGLFETVKSRYCDTQLLHIGKNFAFAKVFNVLHSFFFHFSGDEFALREGGSLYCKNDHDVLEKSAQSRVAPVIESNNNTNLNNNNHSSELGSMSGKRTILFIY